MSSRDLLIFFALCIFPIAGFSLLNYPDTNFYLTLLVLGLVVLFGMKHYHKDSEQLVDYDENMDLLTLGYIGAGALGMLGIAGFLYKNFAQSLLYIPTHQSLQPFAFGTFSLNGFATDILFTLALVATSEEVAKLAVHIAVYIRLKEWFGSQAASIIATVAPIATWAVLHTYRNTAYQGTNMMLAITAAFIGGLIIFAVMKYRKSVLAAILVHSFYNIIVLYFTYYAKLV